MGNITRKISRAGLVLALAGALLLGVSLGDTVISFKAPRSFEDVLENGAAPGDHLSGRVDYLMDAFANMQTWSENTKTHATTAKRTSAQYYVLPGGDSWMGLRVGSRNFSQADKLVEQTYAYLTQGGGVPTAELVLDARVAVMDEELAGLFREELKEYYGYTDQDLEDMGAPLMVEPRAFGTIRVFCAAGAALLVAGGAVLALHWRKVSARLRRSREEAPGPELD